MNPTGTFLIEVLLWKQVSSIHIVQLERMADYD